MKKLILIAFLNIFIIHFLVNADLITPTSIQEHKNLNRLLKASNEFLVSPKALSEEQIVEELKNRDLNMTFYIGKADYFRFKTQNDEVYFEVVFPKEFPDCFEESDKKLFLKESSINHYRQQKFIYSYRWHKIEGEQINVPIEKDVAHADSHAYLAYDRRVFEESTPISLSEKELISIISNNNVVFYTGAGLSAASNVPTMAQLFRLLNLEAGIGFFSSLRLAIAYPHELAFNIKAFHHACFFNPPTKAHYALKQLAYLKKTQIITENVDYLHERTGIMPYRISGDHLRTKIDPSSLQEIDYIICIGLSFDDKGFLGWYKAYHPNGKIIAIDLIQPSYLGSEDYLVQGDLQKIIPELTYQLRCGVLAR